MIYLITHHVTCFFADDLAVVDTWLPSLSRKLDAYVEALELNVFKVNLDKTELMTSFPAEQTHETTLKRVETIKYLESYVSTDIYDEKAVQH